MLGKGTELVIKKQTICYHSDVDTCEPLCNKDVSLMNKIHDT